MKNDQEIRISRLEMIIENINASLLDIKSNGVRFEDKVDARFDDFQHKLDSRFNSIDKKFDSLENKFDSKLEKFDSKLFALDMKLEDKFLHLDSKIESKFLHLDKKFDSGIAWLIGIGAATMLSVFGSIISILINLGQV